MSTNKNKYKTNIHSRDFIVLPVTALDTKIQSGNFIYPILSVDGIPTGATDYYTINEYCTAYNRELVYTTDGLYCFLGINFSDLKNEMKNFKTFIKTAGLVAGGEDFTLMIGDEFWLLGVDELDEWREGKLEVKKQFCLQRDKGWTYGGGE